MITWGLVGNSHDASMAVFEQDSLLWASLAKDFSQIKSDPHINSTQIEYAVNKFGRPDKIVWYERPLLKTLRQFWAGQGFLLKENNIKEYLSKRNIIAPISYTQHHHSHAAYAYYTQSYSDCAVICLDSIGEFETLTVWHGINGDLRKIYSQGYPHSLGLFYSAMTQRVGLVAQQDEYKIALMAEQGDSNRFYSLLLDEIIHIGFPKITLKQNLHRGCRWWHPEIQSEQDYYDLAAGVQRIFEECVDSLSRWAKLKTGSEFLALAGGGALNKSAVEKIKKYWRNVWVPPNPGDPGSCIGSVLAKTKTFTSIDNAWHKVI